MYWCVALKFLSETTPLVWAFIERVTSSVCAGASNRKNKLSDSVSFLISMASGNSICISSTETGRTSSLELASERRSRSHFWRQCFLP